MHGSSRIARRWGTFVAARRWWFVGAWIALFAVAGYLSQGTARLLSPAGFETDTPAARAAAILREHFPERKAPVLYAVFDSPVPLSDPAYAAQAAAWRDDLARLAGSGAVVRGPLPGDDGRTAAVVVESSQTPDHFIELAHQAAGVHHAGPARVYLGGLGPVYDDFVALSESDLRQSELESLPIAVVLLLLVFGGVVAGVLPVLTGLASVTVATALLGLVARGHTVSVFALNVSSVVGLGLGIDYSLLVVNRFREELRAGASREAAVGTTVGTAGVATVVSGATVAIGFGSLLLTHLNVLWSIGVGGALVVAVSIVSSLTLMPALIAVFGSSVDRLTLPFARGRDTRALWHRLASGVMRRPAVVILAVLAAMVALASPAFHFHAGVVGTESLPPSQDAVVADRLARAHLGFPEHAPVLAVARGVSSPEQAAAVEARLRSAAGRGRVAGFQEAPPEARPLYLRDGYAVFELEQPGPDNADETHAFLDRVRAVHVDGGSLLVGGEAAAYQDFVALLARDFPVSFGAVLVLTFLLLGAAFRSIAIPVKAILMNLLSISAALGVLTWVFQEGHGARLLDFQAVGFIDATLPVILFAALFGLSMDYEVFLLSRVAEEYRRTGDNQAAVAAGMERTGQIITSAALILVVVVGTLAFSHLVLNKSLGVTFAVAVLLDATLVRLLLVPAMMRVLGRANWWPGVWDLPAV